MSKTTEPAPVVDDLNLLMPPFKVSTQTLMNLVDPKNPDALCALGGVAGVAAALHVDLAQGISDDVHLASSAQDKKPSSFKAEPVTIATRQSVFGTNFIPPTKQRSFLLLFWDALHEKILIMLIIAALVSLAMGIFQDHQREPGTGQDHAHSWIEGLAILVAVLVCSLVSAANDYQKERAFRRLSAKISNRTLRIIRNGTECQIGIHELVVGDVLLLEPGDVLPADGIIIESFNMSCDESGATGESDAVPKAAVKDSKGGKGARDETEEHPSDPFVLAGTKLVQGIGRALVICVGRNSSSGRIMVSLSAKKENTPLQQKLDDLAERIAKIGAATALTMLLVLVIKFVVVESKTGFSNGSIYNTKHITNIFIQAITILVVAVPEGLPMAVTIALAFATAKMVADNNLVRVLAACETMGNATTICSDKTGTLTTNVMTVVQGRIGSLECTNEEQVKHDFKLKLKDTMQELLVKSIAYNSTASLTPPVEKTEPVPMSSSSALVSPPTSTPGPIQNTAGVGSKTEIALLDLATHMLGTDSTSLRQQANIHAMYPFSSAAKSMTIVIKEATNDFCIYTKGASEIILSLCDRAYQQDGTLKKIDSESWLAYIDVLARSGLRTIALAVRHVESQSALDSVLRSPSGTDGSPPFLSNSFCLLGIVGIQDPVRPGVPEAVLSCQRAGIMVRMVTGDNATTAASIARSCHILTRGGLTLEGPAFRALSDEALITALPRLQVLARSSPLDKERLVRALKSQGHVVAATGDGTNDGPALRAADVGLSMGIAGTEVAKEASSIVLLDDNFTSVVKAVAWGRCVNDSVRKFLQFQLTVNLTAVVVAFVSACIDKECRSALTAVQLLWVNLLMDTMAALALATDSPTPALLERKPEPKRQSLVTRDMWKIIIGTTLFQVTAMLVLLYLGPSIFRLDMDLKENEDKLRTIIFNSFVWLQIFNEINCRVLGSRSLNPFLSFFSNWIFIAVQLFTILGQVIIVTWLGAGFSTVPLPIGIWGICIAIGAMSLPVGLILRLLPAIKEPIRSATRDAERAAFSKERLQWQAAITDVRHGLSVFAALRRPQQNVSLVALSAGASNSKSHQSNLDLLPTPESP